jgi:hypothetical protein
MLKNFLKIISRKEGNPMNLELSDKEKETPNRACQVWPPGIPSRESGYLLVPGGMNETFRV